MWGLEGEWLLGGGWTDVDGSKILYLHAKSRCSILRRTIHGYRKNPKKIYFEVYNFVCMPGTSHASGFVLLRSPIGRKCLAEADPIPLSKHNSDPTYYTTIKAQLGSYIREENAENLLSGGRNWGMIANHPA